MSTTVENHKTDVKSVDALAQNFRDLKAEIGKVIIGQEDVVNAVLIALFSNGHSLLVGVPGLAKTLLVSTISEVLDLDFKRIQFTPDLMPSDIMGSEILDDNRKFTFNKGPLFANIVLADEINRTPPKTQAALLEAMQEKSVTVSGTRHILPKPFFVLATQNPIEQEGTYPLPEAQLDRFLLYLRLNYPSEQKELDILKATTSDTTTPLNAVISGDDILQLQTLVRQVMISMDMLTFVNQFIRETRPSLTAIDAIKEWVEWGAGTRAGQALILSAKANALLNGRYSVTYEDIKALAHPVLRHRILINYKGESDGITSDDITDLLLEQVEIPNVL